MLRSAVKRGIRQPGASVDGPSPDDHCHRMMVFRYSLVSDRFQDEDIELLFHGVTAPH